MDVRLANYLEPKTRFMASRDNLKECSKVILGLPMDSTTSFRPGTRMGPARVREVSEGIEEYSFYQRKSLEELNFYDAGDIRIPFGNVEESLRRMETVALALLQEGKKLFCMGGEHLVSWPIIKAYHKIYPELRVIHLDAHADLREDYLGEKLSHATVMRRVVEMIGDRRLLQMGIRSGTEDEMRFATEHTCFYFNRLPDIEEFRELLKDYPVYISLDIDVLDPAFAPGTGTPEAGGFSSRQLLELLLNLKQFNIVGFDMVEISPPYDFGDNTALLGAKIMREALLAY